MAQLTSVVYVVTELERSVEFYRGLLGFDLVEAEDEAVVLRNIEGSRLVLRAFVNAPHVTMHVGAQYCAWGVSSLEELERAESWLVEHQALVSRSRFGEVEVVEGRDPDRLPVLLHYPARLVGHTPHEVFPRLYEY